MSDVQMFWSSCAECVEFLSQRRSGGVLMEFAVNTVELLTSCDISSKKGSGNGVVWCSSGPRDNRVKWLGNKKKKKNNRKV